MSCGHLHAAASSTQLTQHHDAVSAFPFPSSFLLVIELGMSWAADLSLWLLRNQGVGGPETLGTVILQDWTARLAAFGDGTVTR
jgi:hypothetical protein